MICYDMTTQKEMNKINRMMELIKKQGRIDKYNLVMQSGLSISYYEKLKPFMERIFAHNVQYDKNTQTWIWIRTEEVSP